MESASAETPETYVSCIRINGVPILPPFMTNEYRSEMRRYRDSAARVQQRIRERHSNDNRTPKCSTPVRRNSYTLDGPSPLLLAHLEERSLAEGVDPRSISMSESIVGERPDKSPPSEPTEIMVEDESSSSTPSNEQTTNQDVTSVIFDEESKAPDEPPFDVSRLLSEAELEHEKRLVELIAKQEEEQLRLRRAFEIRREMLLSRPESAPLSPPDIAAKDAIMTEDPKTETPHRPDEMSTFMTLSADVLNESRRVLSDRSKSANNNLIKHSPADFAERDEKDAPPESQRTTADTLDDVNSTFASTDPESENDVRFPSPLLVPENGHDGMTKLKSAFDKIARIQRNLACQSAYKSLPIDDDIYSFTPGYNNNGEDAKSEISLSSISLRSPSFDSYTTEPSVARKPLSLNLIDISRPNDNGTLYGETEIRAANLIVAYAKGFLTRRLMRTERVQSTVQTIKDALLCALQLHRDERGIRGADVDLHRRLIQQITAACYSLHDIFIYSTAAERMAIVSHDRNRRALLSNRSGSAASSSSVKRLSLTTQKFIRKKMETMSKSHSGVFGPTSREFRPNLMTRSHYEGAKGSPNERPRRSVAVAGELSSRKPWR